MITGEWSDVAEQQRQDALRRLGIEEADAWFEYLAATQGQPEHRYAECEPWAWVRLQQRIRAVDARRAKVRG